MSNRHASAAKGDLRPSDAWAAKSGSPDPAVRIRAMAFSVE